MTDPDRFEKNVKRWSAFCPESAKKLQNMECNRVSFCQTENGLPNLKISDNGQIHYFHSQKDPLAEINDVINPVELPTIQVLYVYGVGLGYTYEALKNWLRSSPSHFLVFLEPDLEIIHRLLETERGTEILHDPSVLLFHYEVPRLISQISGYFAVQPYTVVSAPIYQLLYPDQFHDVKTKISFNHNMKSMAYTEFQSYGLGFFTNFFRNVYNLPYAYKGNGLYSNFVGVPAIICGAGPSLAKNIDVLKKLTDRALIFAGGTAMNAVNGLGLIPHFGIGVDPNRDQFTRIIMNQAYETPFFYRNRWNDDCLAITHGDKLYITGSGGYKASEWIEKRFNIEGKFIEEGCNVINLSLAIAAEMGCNPIILVGVDLAYSNNQSYAPGILNHPLHNRKQHFRTKESTDELIIKDDINGEQVYTLWKWVTESFWFSNYATVNPSIKLINCTEGGLGFAGVPNMPLALAAEKYLPKQYDITGRIHGEIQNSRMPSSLTTVAVQKTMEELAESLEKCGNLYDKIHNELNGLINENLKSENPSPIHQTDSMAEIFQEIEKEEAFIYFLHGLNGSFAQLNERDERRLEWDKEILDLKDLNHKKLQLEDRRVVYLREAARMNAAFLRTVINDQATIQKQMAHQESRNKPPPPPDPFQNGAIYSYENNVLKIIDPEFKISYQETFEPSPSGGVSRIHYPDGSLKFESYYRSGRLHGPSSFFSPEGKLLARSWYINGLKHGKSLTYYADGSLKSIQRFRDGIWDGKQEYYFPNGTKRSIINYKNGVLHGDVFLYHHTGKFARELHYIDGKRNGVERVWNSVGLLSIEANYKDDKPIGTARMWFPNGNIAQESVYDEERGICLVNRWNQNGIPFKEEQLVREDYFDKVTKQTTALTKSLGTVFEELSTFAPLFSDIIDPEHKNPALNNVQEDLHEVAKEMEHLKELGKELMFESGIDPDNPNESLWKSPTSQREMEVKLDTMTKKMTKDISNIHGSFSKTLELLKRKFESESPN